MNELVDFGFTQLSTVTQLNSIIQTPKEEDSNMFNIKIGNSHKTNANASKRSIHKGKLEF